MSSSRKSGGAPEQLLVPSRGSRRRPPRQPEIVCIFGRRGSGKTTLARKLIEGRKRVIVFDTLGEYEAPAIATHPLELLGLTNAAEFFIAYRPQDAVKEFPWVCRIAYAVRDLTILCEEVDFFVDPWKLDQAFEILIRYGRHRGIEMICVSRRPAEVNRNLTAQASRLYVFKMHEPRDLTYFRQIIGPAADGIPALPDFKPLEWRC